MTGPRSDETPLGIQGMLGLGLDGQQGDLRVTRGANFYIYGGSRPTHQKMLETALRLNDEVDRRGKSLEQINARELEEISRTLRGEQ